MVKIIFLLLFFNVQRDNDCIDTLVNKAFDSSFKADYILFLPVETTDGIGRLMITKENLRKYMIAADSSFLSNDIIKDFVKRVINKKQKFYFVESFYKTTFGSSEYKIFYKKNKFEYLNKKNKSTFLRKYVSNYNEKENYFNFNSTVSSMDIWPAYEHLFKLNFLVAHGDGSVGVYRAECNR